MLTVSYPLPSIDAVRFTHAWEDRQPIEHAGRRCVVLSRRVERRPAAMMTFELAYLTDDQLEEHYRQLCDATGCPKHVDPIEHVWQLRNFVEGPAQRAVDTVNELTELLSCEDGELIERVCQLTKPNAMVQGTPTRATIQVAQGEALDRFGLALGCPRAVRVFNDPGPCEYECDADYQDRLLSKLPPDFTQWTALADLTVESAQPLVGQWIEGKHRDGEPTLPFPEVVRRVVRFTDDRDVCAATVQIILGSGWINNRDWLVRLAPVERVFADWLVRVVAPTAESTFELPDNARIDFRDDDETHSVKLNRSAFKDPDHVTAREVYEVARQDPQHGWRFGLTDEGLSVHLGSAATVADPTAELSSDAVAFVGETR